MSTGWISCPSLTRRLHQGAQARPAGRLQDAQSVPGENAVLPGQRHQVGDRAHRDQVQVIAQRNSKAAARFPPAAASEAVHQLEDEPDRAQVAPGLVMAVGARVHVGLMRIPPRSAPAVER